MPASTTKDGCSGSVSLMSNASEALPFTGKLCVKLVYDFTNDLSDDSYYLSMIPNPIKSSVDS